MPTAGCANVTVKLFRDVVGVISVSAPLPRLSPSLQVTVRLSAGAGSTVVVLHCSNETAGQ